MPAGFSSLDFFYILPELVLTGGAMLLLLLAVLVPRRDGLLLWTALAAVALTLVLVVRFFGLDVTASRGLLAIDSFAAFFKVVVLLSAALTLLMSAPYLKVEGIRVGEYYFLILCATLGMMFMGGLSQTEPAFERGGRQIFPARGVLAGHPALWHVAGLRRDRHD